DVLGVARTPAGHDGDVIEAVGAAARFADPDLELSQYRPPYSPREPLRIDAPLCGAREGEQRQELPQDTGGRAPYRLALELEERHVARPHRQLPDLFPVHAVVEQLVHRNVEDTLDLGRVRACVGAPVELADERRDDESAGHRGEPVELAQDAHVLGLDTNFLARLAEGGREQVLARVLPSAGKGNLTPVRGQV